MINMSRLQVLVAIACSLLMGCQQPLSYDYLMLHPKAINDAYQQCQLQELAQCKEVEAAARDFAALLYEEMTAPQRFGKKVMDAQLTLNALYQQYQQSSAAKKAEAKKAYDVQNKKIRYLYAVIAMNGPE